MNPRCEARASRTDAQCRQPASIDANGDGVFDSCFLPNHQQQVASRSSIPPADPVTPAQPAAANQQPDQDAILQQLLAGLPPAPSEADEITRITSSPPPADLADMEKRAEQTLGAEVPEDAAAADDMLEREQLTPSQQKLRSATDSWGRDRIAFYLRVIINRKFERDGKEKLTRDEIEEGADIAMQMLEDVNALAIRNPFVAFALWLAVIIGARYWEEVLARILALFFGKKQIAPPASSAPPAPPPQPFDDTMAGAGWNLRASN